MGKGVIKKEVEYVSALARLEFSEVEKEEYASALVNMLEYVKLLNELDVEGVEAAYHVMPVMNVMREDVEKPSMGREMVLDNGPDTQDGCFKVPKVIE